jgi:hypothetical protein
LKTLCKNIKVAYSLRDPVKRLWSHTRFHAAVNGVFDSLRDWNVDEFREFLKSTDMVLHGTYSQVIKKIRHHLKPDQFELFYFEDFRDRPLEELRRLEKFLSIGPKEYTSLDFHNPTQNLDMPEAFLSASCDILLAELDRLQGLNIRNPERWTTRLELESFRDCLKRQAIPFYHAGPG